MTTTDLAKFGSSERKMLVELLIAWTEQGLPEAFYDNEVIPMMNTTSGLVFLTNSEYQVCMLNDDKLEMFYYCHNCGNEGFEEDCKLTDDGCNNCN